MKKDIHPKYEKTKIICACGNEFETRSTAAPEIKVELCSLCHPFYTGKQKFVDTAGRVDKFQARMKASETKKSAKKPKTDAKKSEAKSNKETLTDIKSSFTKVTDDAKDNATDTKKAKSSTSTDGAANN